LAYWTYRLNADHFSWLSLFPAPLQRWCCSPYSECSSAVQDRPRRRRCRCPARRQRP